MPRGDGTGPNGMGPMTGRGMGYCAGFNRPGFARPGSNRAMGRGFGRRVGFRNIPLQPQPVQQPMQPRQYPQTRDQEVQALKQEKQAIENELEQIENRINQLENQDD